MLADVKIPPQLNWIVGGKRVNDPKWKDVVNPFYQEYRRYNRFCAWSEYSHNFLKVAFCLCKI